MFTYTLGGVEYSFDLRLGVTVKIKKAFNMKYTTLLEKIDELDIDQWVKFIYNCLDDGQYDGTYKEFLDLMYDESNVGEMQDCLLSLIKKLQYPEKTIEEIDEMLKKQQTLT